MMGTHDQQIAALKPAQLERYLQYMAAHKDSYSESIREAAALMAANKVSPDAKPTHVSLLPRFVDLVAPQIGWQLPAAITDAEWSGARLTPGRIVANYLFKDVGVLVAPGGTGKTTLLLYEAVHIVLGLPLYGQAIEAPAPVILVTAEDGREMLVARLRLICEALRLTVAQIAIVMRDVRISDVSGRGFKLATLAADAVVPSAMVDIIISEVAALKPALIVFDPAISFGIGEARVNDAEQGMIEAGRRLRNELVCGVRFSHHSGKQNARDRTADQYTGRGGSAMADGARMVAVLQPLTREEWLDATGVSLADGETGMVLARPKSSYCPPQPDILIARKGYAFTHTLRTELEPGAALQANCDQLLQALTHDLAKGRQHTKNSLEALKLMHRVDLRHALNTLLVRDQVVMVRSTKKGGPQHFLQPQASPNQSGEPLPL